MLVPAGCAVGASAVAEFELAALEVLLEFPPFLVGGFTVFGLGAHGAPLLEERAVGPD